VRECGCGNTSAIVGAGKIRSGRWFCRLSGVKGQYLQMSLRVGSGRSRRCVGFFIFLQRCHLGLMALAGAPPALPARLGNEPPTTFHCCRCASSPGAMSLHLRRSNRVITIHRPARSKQCWAWTRDRTFQDTLRGHESRGIQGCTAPRNRRRIRQGGAAGHAHTRPRGNIGLIAVYALTSCVAEAIITPPSTGPSGHTA